MVKVTNVYESKDGCGYWVEFDGRNMVKFRKCQKLTTDSKLSLKEEITADLIKSWLDNKKETDEKAI